MWCRARGGKAVRRCGARGASAFAAGSSDSSRRLRTRRCAARKALRRAKPRLCVDGGEVGALGEERGLSGGAAGARLAAVVGAAPARAAVAAAVGQRRARARPRPQHVAASQTLRRRGPTKRARLLGSAWCCQGSASCAVGTAPGRAALPPRERRLHGGNAPGRRVSDCAVSYDCGLYAHATAPRSSPAPRCRAQAARQLVPCSVLCVFRLRFVKTA